MGGVHVQASRSTSGLAVLVVLLAAAVVGAGVLLSFEAPDPASPGTRFATTGSSVLCSGLGNPVASTSQGTPAVDLHVDVSCDDELPTTLAVRSASDGVETELYRLSFTDAGDVAAETPFGARTLPHATAGELSILAAGDDDGYDWVLTAGEDDPAGSDPLGDGAAGETCTPGEAVLCIDAREGATVRIPGTPGGDDGTLVAVHDLVAAVEGAVPEDPDGPSEDVRQGRFCLPGGSAVRTDAGLGDAAPGEHCLLKLDVDDGEVTTVVDRVQDRYQDVDAVVFHEKTLTVERDGEALLTVTVPNPEDVPTRKPGVTVRGQGPCTHVTDEITVTVDGTEDDPCDGDPQRVDVTDPDGGTSATVERLGDGRYHVGTPAGGVTVEAQAVRVLADPSDADAETVVELVDAAGGTAATVTLREPAARLLPGETEVHVAREVEGQTGVDLTKVVSDLLVVEDDDGDGTPERVAAFPGRAVGEAPLHMGYDGGDWTVATPEGTATLQGAEVTVAPDAAEPGTVHVLLRDADGATLARFTLDVDDAPPTLEYSVDGVGDGTVAPPVSVSPGPRDRESVTVSGPDGDPLLVYREDGSEATVEVPPAGETRTVDRRTARLEGDPLRDDQWTLAVETPDGGESVRYTVNRPNYEQALRDADQGTPADLGPVVSVVPEAPGTGEADFLDLVTDGENHRSQERDLDGTRWMSGLRPLAFEASFDDTTTYDSYYVRYAAREPVPLDAPRVTLTPVEEGDEGNRTGSVVLADRSSGWDGRTLRFEVVAERPVGDGLVAYARVDNRTDDAPYAVRVDAKRPTASISSPDDPDGSTWLVTWEGTDTGSGVSSFEVEVDRDASGWEHHTGPTTGRSVQFTGEADTTYRYRARSTDAVGHAGPWSPASTTEHQAPDPGDGGIPGGDTSGNEAPTVDLVSPASGATLEGLVEVRWSADDPDGTAPAVDVDVSSDGGTTWTGLRTTSDRAYWDTTGWPDGDDYRVRATADDGTLADEDVVGDLTVDNPASEEASGPGDPSPGSSTGGGDGNGDGSADPGSGDDDGGNGVPGPGVVAAVAAAGAAALARRRRGR